jgi:hypothetical protein
MPNNAALGRPGRRLVSEDAPAPPDGGGAGPAAAVVVAVAASEEVPGDPGEGGDGGDAGVGDPGTTIHEAASPTVVLTDPAGHAVHAP